MDTKPPTAVLILSNKNLFFHKRTLTLMCTSQSEGDIAHCWTGRWHTYYPTIGNNGKKKYDCALRSLQMLHMTHTTTKCMWLRMMQMIGTSRPAKSMRIATRSKECAWDLVGWISWNGMPTKTIEWERNGALGGCMDDFKWYDHQDKRVSAHWRVPCPPPPSHKAFTPSGGVVRRVLPPRLHMRPWVRGALELMH